MAERKQTIGELPAETLAARLRPYLADIDEQVGQGVRHRQVIQALAEQGIVISLKLFRQYLYRWRKAQGTSQPARRASQQERGPDSGADPKLNLRKQTEDNAYREADRYERMTKPVERRK